MHYCSATPIFEFYEIAIIINMQLILLMYKILFWTIVFLSYKSVLTLVLNTIIEILNPVNLIVQKPNCFQVFTEELTEDLNRTWRGVSFGNPSGIRHILFQALAFFSCVLQVQTTHQM